MKFIVTKNLDILLITESKLDLSFPANQFIIEGFSPPFRADRDSKGGGVLIYAREDVACRELKCHSSLKCIEGIFIEMNLKKSKWLLFGGYNPNKDRISDFVIQEGSVLDYYMPRYENVLLLGDFNSEMSEFAMSEFSQMYNLTNLIKEPMCFKNPSNPSLIDLILTNRARSFQNSQVIETGLSDHHKLTIRILKISFQKQVPITITYRNYKNYDQSLFHHELIEKLGNINDSKVNYDTFETVFITLLN